MRHLARLAACVIVTAAAAAQSAEDLQGPTPDERDLRIRERYEQSIQANPYQQQAFDRVYDSYLAYEGIDRWIESLEAAAEAEPTPGPLILLGRIHERQFKNDEAIQFLDRAVEAGADGPELDVLYGTLCYQAGRNDDAIDRLTRSLEALDDAEERGRVCRLLGSLYMRKGDPEAAVTAWERLTELNPGDLFVQTELAEIYEDNRMWDRAVGVYEAIIATSETDPYRQCRSLRAIGRCRLEEENHAAAIAAYEEALGLAAPGNWLFEDLKDRLVAVYQDLGDLQGLAAYLTARIEDAPGDIEFRDLLAETYSRMGAFDKAEAEYDAILERHPGRTGIYEKLIKLYARTDREDRVVETYETLVELYPSEPDYLRRLGETHLHADRPDEAKAVWHRWFASERTPKRLATVADWLESYDFPADAIALYAEALESEPNKDWSLRLAALHHGQGDEDAALTTWSKILERDNVSASEYAEIANVLESYGYNEQARPLLEQGLERDGANHEIRFSLAQNLTRAENYQDALPYFVQLAAVQDNEYFAERGERGMIDCYLQLNMLKEKQAEWEREADANPDSAEILSRLARLHDRAGASDKALVLYERCVELEPNSPVYLRSLAGALRRARDLERAVETFERLVAADPNRAGGYYREVLGIYLTADLKSDAIATARKIVEIAPGDAEARLDLAQVYQTYRMHEEALAQYRHALRLEPDEPQYHRFYGDALAELERWGEAGEAYRDMLATAVEDETRVEAVRQLASIYLRQERVDDLLREFQRRVRNTPKKLAAYQELATIHQEAGDTTRALDRLEEGLAAVDDKTPALKALIRTAYEAEHYEKVVQHFEALIDLSGTASAFEYERLGTVYSQLGDLEKARETWARIPESDPNNARSYTTLARVLSREGLTEEALAAQAKALELEPRDHRLRFEYAKQLAGAEQAERALEEYGRILELGESVDSGEEEKKEKQVKSRSRGQAAGSLARAWYGSSRAWNGVSYQGGRSFRDVRREVVSAMAGVANESIGVEELLARLRERVDQNPADFQARFNLLMAYQAASYGPDAITLVEAMLDEQPDNVELLEEAAMIYSWQQDMEQSIAVLDRLAELQPKKRGQHLIARLNLQLRQGNDTEADALTNELLDEYGRDPQVFEEIINSCRYANRYDRLDALVPALAKLEPKPRRDVQWQLASTMRRGGDQEAAKGLCRRLLFDDDLQHANLRYRSPRRDFYAPQASHANYIQYLSNGNWSYALRSLGLMRYVDEARGGALWSLAQMANSPEERAALMRDVHAYVRENANSGDINRRTNARELGKLAIGLRCGRGEYEAALDDLDALADLGVDDVEAMNLRAFALHQLDRRDGVDAVYAELRKRYPSRTRDLLEARMHLAIARRDYDAAAAAVQEFVQQGVPPNKAVDAIQLLYNVQEREHAKALLQSLLKGMRRNKEAVLLLARIHADQNEFDEALALAREAWKQSAHKRSRRSQSRYYYGGYYGMYYGSSQNLPMNPVLGELYQYAKGAGKARDLVAEFEDRLAKQPGAVHHYENLINLHKLTGERSRAIAVCEQLIDARPNYAQGRMQLAQLFVEKGDQERALEIYETMMERNPAAYDSIRWSIRQLYQTTGRGSELAKLDAEMARKASNPQQIEQLASQFHNQGEYEQAAELYEKVVKMDPSRVYTRANLAQLYVMMGRMDDALDAYKHYLTAPQLRGNRSISQYTIGHMIAAFEVAGREDDLVTILSDTLSDKSHEHVVQFIRAMMTKREGKLAEAEEALRGLLEDNPGQSHVLGELFELASFSDTPEATLEFLEEHNAAAAYYDPQQIANLYMTVGDADRAYEHIERMAQRYGGGWGYTQALQMLVQSGLWEKAAQFYKKHQNAIAIDSNVMRSFANQAAYAHLLGFGFDDLVESELAKPFGPETTPLVRALVRFDPGNASQHGAWLDPVLAQDPDDKAWLAFMAYHLKESGDEAGAIDYARRVVAEDPLDDNMAQELSTSLIRRGEDGPALDLLRTRWEERKDQSRATAYANALFTVGRWHDLAALKKEALDFTDGRERENLQRMFAEFEHAWGDSDGAEATYRGVFENEPDYGGFHQYLGFLSRTQQWEKAQAFLGEHAESPFAGRLNGGADSYLKADVMTNRLEHQADAFWRQAAYGDRWNRQSAAVTAIAAVQDAGQTNAFLAAVERRAPEDVSESVLHEAYAGVYGAASRHAKALEHRQQLVDENPYDQQRVQHMFATLRALNRADGVAALLDGPSMQSSLQQVANERIQLAAAYFDEDRVGAGAKVLDELTAWSNGVNTYAAIGTMLAGLNRYADALPYLENGVRAHNAGRSEGAMLAVAYAAAGRDDDAYDLWFRHRGQSDYMYMMWQLASYGSPELGIRILRQSIADRPGSPQYRLPLARLLHRTGDTEAAFAVFESIDIELTPAAQESCRDRFADWLVEDHQEIAAATRTSPIARGALAHALSILAERGEDARAAALWDAMPQDAEYDADGCVAIGNALADLDHEGAKAWLIKAAAHAGAAFEQRRDAGLRLSALQAYDAASQALAPLLAVRPGMFNRYPEVVEAIVKSGDAAAIEPLMTSFEAHAPYEEHRRFWAALAAHFTTPDASTLADFADVPRLSARQLRVAAEALEHANRPDAAKRFYARLMNGACGELASGHARERLVELAVAEGDFAGATELYAGFLPFRDGYSAAAASAIARAATADDLPAIRSAVASLVARDPAHPGNSDLAAFYAETAERLGGSVATESLLTDAAEREEAQRIAELIESWRFTRAFRLPEANWFLDMSYGEALGFLNAHDAVRFEPADQLGMIPLGNVLGEHGSEDGAFVIGEAVVESDTARSATFHFGGNVTATVWINGKAVKPFAIPAPYADQARFHAQLKAGENRVVVYLCTGSATMSVMQRNTIQLTYGNYFSFSSPFLFYGGQNPFDRQEEQAWRREDDWKHAPLVFGLGIIRETAPAKVAANR